MYDVWATRICMYNASLMQAECIAHKLIYFSVVGRQAATRCCNPLKIYTGACVATGRTDVRPSVRADVRCFVSL